MYWMARLGFLRERSDLVGRGQRRRIEASGARVCVAVAAGEENEMWDAVVDTSSPIYQAV